MGVSCVMRFRKGARVASIYMSNVPDKVREHMAKFFGDVERQCPSPGDARFHDPEYLAAKFLVWTAKQNALNEAAPLDFAGVGVASRNVGDETYDVMCLEGPLSKGRPKVKKAAA